MYYNMSEAGWGQNSVSAILSVGLGHLELQGELGNVVLGSKSRLKTLGVWGAETGETKSLHSDFEGLILML